MKDLIFATNNEHKIREIKSILPEQFHVITLKEAGIEIEIPEPYDTLEENASHKAKTIHQLVRKNCFSEDTGLEVFAINGEPGVLSARYAGEHPSFDDNIQKLLSRLKGIENRSAQFRTVISLILDDTEYQFEGICPGSITTEKKGEKGFGYDPVFIPEGSSESFAEMGLEEKNKFSHRQKAVSKLVEFLKELQ